jgi:hypothetical protein
VRNFCTYFFILIIGLITISCGGGSSTPSQVLTTPVIAKIPIMWPDITKAFDAPKLATSAIIDVEPFDTNVERIFWKVPRPTAGSSEPVYYDSPTQIPSGGVTVRVAFLHDNTVIANSSSRMILSDGGKLFLADGNPLGAIAYKTAFTGINVSSTRFDYRSQLHETTIGQVTPLVVSGEIYVRPTQGTTGQVNIVALNQDEIVKRLNITAMLGSEYVEIRGNEITSILDGDSEIKVTLDEFSSIIKWRVKPETIKPLVISDGLPAVYWDDSIGKLWSFKDNSIGTYDPVAGVYTPQINLPEAPTTLSISHDGRQAYVAFLYPMPGYNGMAVRRIDMRTKQMSNPISVRFNNNGGDRISSIAINPTNNMEAAVCIKYTFLPVYGTPTTWGPVIVRNDVALPDFYINLGYRAPSDIVYGSSTEFFGKGESGGINGNIFETGASASAANVSGTIDYLCNSIRSIVVKNGEVFCGLGYYSYASGPIAITAMTPSTLSAIAATTDKVHNIVWFLSKTKPSDITQPVFPGIRWIAAYDTNTKKLISYIAINMYDSSGKEQMRRFGEKGLIVSTSGSSDYNYSTNGSDVTLLKPRHFIIDSAPGL